MKRRTVIGLAAGTVLTVVAAGVGAGALALGHSGGRAAIMRRVVTAAIEEALDRAQVTADQRVAIHAARDRVYAVVEAERTGRHGHLEEGLRLFESDNPDPALVAALHERADMGRQRVRTAIHEAVVEVHSILTPTQRKAVADYVRSHRFGHLHH
jgi:Spy/CpxP family protein refolding chaperone